MRFLVGDKILHPQYGPGQIVRAENREFVEGFEDYFVIELMIDGSTLFIPRCKMDALGVRPVMSQAKLTRVLTTLQEVPQRLSKDFKVRQARIREKLATAQPTKVAEAIRDLTGRRRKRALTKVDMRLLTRARELLASEVAAVNGIDTLYAHQTIDRALNGKNVRQMSEAKAERAVEVAPMSDEEKLIRRLLRQIKSD